MNRFKNLLITGGAGFIGSNYIDFLLKKHPLTRIINLDLLNYAGNLQNTYKFQKNPNYSFINGNICDYNLINKIFKENKIDGVVNFAAQSHVDNSIKNPDIFVETNILGVHNLLKICYENWMVKPFDHEKDFQHSRFHQISTDEIYGSINEGSFNENSNYKPNSPYSASKASADMLVRSYNMTYGLNTTISVSSNNFGKNQHHEKFIPTIVNCILNKTPIPLYGDGSNIRDWLFVKDNCRMIDQIFNHAKSGSIYNVGAENELTNLEIIQIIFSIINQIRPSKLMINYVKDRPGHDFRYSLDIKKFKSDFKFKKQNSFKENLKKYIETSFKIKNT